MKRLDAQFLIQAKGLENCSDAERLDVAKWLRRDYRRKATDLEWCLYAEKTCVSVGRGSSVEVVQALARAARRVAACAASWDDEPLIPSRYRADLAEVSGRLAAVACRFTALAQFA